MIELFKARNWGIAYLILTLVSGLMVQIWVGLSIEKMFRGKEVLILLEPEIPDMLAVPQKGKK